MTDRSRRSVRYLSNPPFAVAHVILFALD